MTYVSFTREEFEEWLNTLNMPWVQKPGTYGVYWLYVNPAKTVAIQVSSSLTRGDENMGRAQAAMQLSLVSTITIDGREPRCLNKQLQEQSHYKRTTNWKKTLKGGVLKFQEGYKAWSDFYDRLAVIGDTNLAIAKWQYKLQSIPNWEQNQFLSNISAKLSQGKILTVAQEKALDDIYAKAEPLIKAIEAFSSLSELEKLRCLYLVCHRQDQEFVKRCVAAKDFKNRNLQTMLQSYESQMIQFVERNGTAKLIK